MLGLPVTCQRIHIKLVQRREREREREREEVNAKIKLWWRQKGNGKSKRAQILFLANTTSHQACYYLPIQPLIKLVIIFLSLYLHTSVWDPYCSFSLFSFALPLCLASLSMSSFIRISLPRTFNSLIMMVPSCCPGIKPSKPLFGIPTPNKSTFTFVSFTWRPTPSSGLRIAMPQYPILVR